MPLTHVLVWDSKIGYRPVTVEEADDLYPWETVSAKSGHFVCELCAQNVGFTKARKDTGTRNFYHSRGQQDKECADRAQSYDRAVSALNSHSMPIRIEVHNFDFQLQLGFFFPTGSGTICQKRYQIKIRGDAHQVYEYSNERIENSGITYLNIGNEPSQEYQIEYMNLSEEFTKFWPSTAPGISPNGSFFESTSGRMLQIGGKAHPGRTYYLLQRKKLLPYDIPKGISAHLVVEKCTFAFSRWYLYKVEVHTFSAVVARFFLQRSIFLTESQIEFYPIWPPYIEDPYFIYHSENNLYFYMHGENAELKTFPLTYGYFPPKFQSIDNGKLYKIHALSKDQLLSLGIFGALGFSYLLKKELNMQATIPQIYINDADGNLLAMEKYDSLPRARLISISGPFDGKVTVFQNGRIKSIHRLVAEENLTIDNISYGMEVKIYQGCDCVRDIRFVKEIFATGTNTKDGDLVRRLKAVGSSTIPVPHSFGAINQRLQNYPLTKQCISSMVRKGEMPREAYRLIMKSLQK